MEVEMLRSQVLPAGVVRVLHVFIGALHAVQKDRTASQEVWAIRSTKDGFSSMMLVERVECQGPFETVLQLDMPLPGTEGRGVALIYTSAALTVHYIDELKWMDLGADGKMHPRNPAASNPAASKPAAKAIEVVWYTSKSGNRRKYTLLGVEGGRAVLAGENSKGMDVEFSVPETWVEYIR